MQPLITSEPVQSFITQETLGRLVQQNLWIVAKQLVVANAVPLCIFVVTYALLLLVAHKSQADSWCMAHPRLAGLLKLVRGLGIDPWMIVQSVTLLLKARLPNYLLKLLPVAPLASGVAIVPGPGDNGNDATATGGDCCFPSA